MNIQLLQLKIAESKKHSEKLFKISHRLCESSLLVGI